MEQDTLAQLQRQYTLLTVMLDGCRMRQQVLDNMAVAMLSELPRDDARRIAQKTEHLFRQARSLSGEERHPDAEAEALQLLNGLLRAGGAEG